MSSRLFLNIRERLGLAYDVHSFTQKHRDTGYIGVYIGVEPKKAPDAVNAVVAELHALSDVEVSPDELARAKEFTKGRLRLELETTNGVAFWLTYQELLLGKIESIDEELAQVDAVTAGDVRRVAGEVFSGALQMAVIGPFARDTLVASTHAIASGSASDDSHYTSVENSIASLTSQRDTLEAQMRTALTNATFGGATASEQELKDMIARGRQLLDQASALAANS